MTAITAIDGSAKAAGQRRSGGVAPSYISMFGVTLPPLARGAHDNGHCIEQSAAEFARSFPRPFRRDCAATREPYTGNPEEQERSPVSVLSEIEGIVRDELDDDDIVLGPETAAKDVTKWDNLANIRIMVVIERHFRIKFSTMEITEIPNIGELVRTIASRL